MLLKLLQSWEAFSAQKAASQKGLGDLKCPNVYTWGSGRALSVPLHMALVGSSVNAKCSWSLVLKKMN